MVVLVTGCGAGIGLLTAVEAARRGHTVYAGLRDLATADALVAAAGALDVRPVQLDVTDPTQRQAVVDRIVDAHGRVDALVNNAGRGLGGPMELLDQDEIEALFDLNVIAPWALTKAVLPAMRAQGLGVVINVSSVSGRMATPGLGAYAASKFALEGWTEALRYEVSQFGVTVVLVEPGPFKTDIFGRNKVVGRRVHDPDSPYAAMVAHMEGLVDRWTATAQDPQHVADRIVDLLVARRPALRHVVGWSGRVRLAAKRLLPDRWFAAAVQAVVRPR